MFITLKSVLRNLVLPPAGPLLLAGLGLWLLARRRRGEPGRKGAWALVCAALATLWLLSLPVIGNGLSHLAQRYPPLDLTRPVRAEAVVILGGGYVRDAPEYGGPAAGFVLLERLTYGAYLAHRTGLPVLVSGNGFEALAMQATLWRDFGIRARWVEGESRDTFQNAQFSAKLLRADGVSRVALVTSADHEWRAAHEFMSAGLAVDPAPVHVWSPSPNHLDDYLPDSVGLYKSREAIYEIVGDWVRRLLAVTHLRTQSA
ncbi:MAG TPA: YdcF family protein [Steroidobacteraceae bacterium]|nr:YdcF family protein [Steroidobacteraceae bacterium]